MAEITHIESSLNWQIEKAYDERKQLPLISDTGEDIREYMLKIRLEKIQAQKEVILPIARLCPNPVGGVWVYESMHIDWFEDDIKWTRATHTPFDQMRKMMKRLKNHMEITRIPIYRGTIQGDFTLLPEFKATKLQEKQHNHVTWKSVIGNWMINLRLIYDLPTEDSAVDDMLARGITREDFHHAELVWWIQTEESKKHDAYVKMIILFDPNKLERLMGVQIALRTDSQLCVELPDGSPYSTTGVTLENNCFYQHTAI